MRFRLSSAGSAALWRDRIRSPRTCNQSRRKTKEAENAFRSAGSLRLRRAGCRSLQELEAVRARRVRNYRFEFALPQEERAPGEDIEPRHGLARYRYANQLA